MLKDQRLLNHQVMAMQNQSEGSCAQRTYHKPTHILHIISAVQHDQNQKGVIFSHELHGNSHIFKWNVNKNVHRTVLGHGSENQLLKFMNDWGCMCHRKSDFRISINDMDKDWTFYIVKVRV